MTATTRPHEKGDEDLLARFGYPQQLRRTLGRFSMFALAFSIISLTTGIYTNLGFGLSTFGGAELWLWPAAAAGQLLASFVLAEMASRMPVAGYSFQWAGRLIGPRFGWFVAWNLILVLGFVSGAETLFLLSPVIASIFGLNVASKTLILVISILVMLACAGATMFGVRLTARLNNYSVATEVLGTFVVAIVLLIAIAIGVHHTHGFSILTNTGTIPKGELFIEAMGLALLTGIFTIGGFEGCADLGEETVGVQRAAAKGIIYAVAISGVLGFVTLLALTLGIQNLSATASSPTPVTDIIQFWFGTVFTKIWLVTVAYSVFALMVVQVAMVGRLIFSLSRDGMFPGHKYFSKVHPTYRTPLAGLALTVAFYIAVIVYANYQGSAYEKLVGSGIVEYQFAYLCMIGAYAWKRRTIPASEAFDLKRWAKPLIAFSILWLVLLLVIFCSSSEFRTGVEIAAVCEAIGLVLIFTWVNYAVRHGAGSSLAKGRLAPEHGEGELVR